MKRNLDLCREILLYVEENGKPFQHLEIELSNYTNEEISYHLQLLEDAGYLKIVPICPFENLVDGSLSWNAHEYIDALRSEKSWNKAKEFIKNKIDSASFSVILSVVNRIATGLLFEK